MWASRIRLALIGGLLAVGAYFGERFVNPWQSRNDDEYSEGIPVDKTDLDFRLSGRPDFRVCVDRVGDGSETSLAELALVKSALDRALADAPYVPPFYTEQAGNDRDWVSFA